MLTDYLELDNYWHWFVIIFVFLNIFACWWLLRWSSQTKVDSHDNTTGHIWDGDLQELNNPLPRWWLILFHMTIVFALAYLFFYPGLGNYKGSLDWTQENQLEQVMQANAVKAESLQTFWNKMDIETLANNASALDTGTRMYAQYCAMCHGSDAKGAKGYPNLTDNVWLWGSDLAAIETTIRSGRHAVMQAWKDQYTATEISALATYSQSLSGRKTDAELTAQGKVLFSKTCVACHGMQGKGLQALGAPDLTNNVWLYGSDLASIEHTIREGRNGVMPAQESLMSEYELKVLTAYIYHLKQESEKAKN